MVKVIKLTQIVIVPNDFIWIGYMSKVLHSYCYHSVHLCPEVNTLSGFHCTLLLRMGFPLKMIVLTLPSWAWIANVVVTIWVFYKTNYILESRLSTCLEAKEASHSKFCRDALFHFFTFYFFYFFTFLLG